MLSETETEIDSVRVLVLESGLTGIGVNCFNISANSFSLCLSPSPMLSRARIVSNSAEATAKVVAALAMLLFTAVRSNLLVVAGRGGGSRIRRTFKVPNSISIINEYDNGQSNAKSNQLYNRVGCF